MAAASGDQTIQHQRDAAGTLGKGTPRRPVRDASLAGLSLAALGVVFGDIGTSPLYTFKTVLDLNGDHPAPATTLGALSLIVWTLILVTSISDIA